MILNKGLRDTGGILVVALLCAVRMGNGPATRRGQGGFSLIELLVAITVAAILASFAVPSMLSMVRNDRLSSQANNLLFALTYARGEAIKRDSLVCVCAASTTSTSSSPACGSSWSHGWLVHVPSGTDCTAPSTLLQASTALSSNVTLKAMVGSNSVSSVGFVGSGIDYAGNSQIAQSSTVDFVLCDARGAGYARDLEISPVGRAQIGPTAGQALNTSVSLSCP